MMIRSRSRLFCSSPMPVIEAAAEAEVAPPVARGRTGPARGYSGSQIANAPPIHEDATMREARRHDRAADRRFVEALAPALSPRGRQRARAVRVQAGDPAAQLLG